MTKNIKLPKSPTYYKEKLNSLSTIPKVGVFDMFTPNMIIDKIKEGKFEVYNNNENYKGKYRALYNCKAIVRLNEDQVKILVSYKIRPIIFIVMVLAVFIGFSFSLVKDIKNLNNILPLVFCLYALIRMIYTYIRMIHIFRHFIINYFNSL